MKEHFNSVNPMFDGVKNHGLYQTNFSRSPREVETNSNESLLTGDVSKPETEDLFNGRLLNSDALTDNGIDQMDLAAALDSINFIRDLGSKPEGRSLMSKAHNPVDPGEVIKLFGI